MHNQPHQPNTQSNASLIQTLSHGTWIQANIDHDEVAHADANLADSIAHNGNNDDDVDSADNDCDIV